MGKYCLFFISVLLAGTSFAQKKSNLFISANVGERSSLTMLTDSTMAQRLVQHVGPILETIYKYRSTDSTIEILGQLSPSPDYHHLQAYQTFGSFKAGDVFTKIDGGIINYADSLLYVSEFNYRKNTRVTLVIDGRRSRQSRGKTDGYGLVRRDAKINRALQRTLKSLKEDDSKYTVEMLSGIRAYQRYGIDAVYGVLVINTKK